MNLLYPFPFKSQIEKEGTELSSVEHLKVTVDWGESGGGVGVWETSVKSLSCNSNPQD